LIKNFSPPHLPRFSQGNASFHITLRTAKMKTQKIILFLLMLLYPITHAQITISGNVSDDELNPVNNALVQILDEGNKSNSYSTYTDQS